MKTLELIKDTCLHGGTVPNERAEEVRRFLDNLKQPSKVETIEYVLVIEGIRKARSIYHAVSILGNPYKTFKIKEAKTFPTLERAIIHNTNYLNGEFTLEPIQK